MNWLKGLGISVKVAALAFLAALAVMAAKYQKDRADKWVKRSEDEKEADVQAGTRKAQQSLTQAKLHENKAAKAKEAATKSIDAIGRSDETLAEIVSGWSAD